MKIIKSFKENFSDILETGFLVFISLLFSIELFGSCKELIINLCLAFISFLFVVVEIYIIIGLCNILKGLIERYGE